MLLRNLVRALFVEFFILLSFMYYFFNLRNTPEVINENEANNLLTITPLTNSEDGAAIEVRRSAIVEQVLMSSAVVVFVLGAAGYAVDNALHQARMQALARERLRSNQLPDYFDLEACLSFARNTLYSREERASDLNGYLQKLTVSELLQVRNNRDLRDALIALGVDNTFLTEPLDGPVFQENEVLFVETPCGDKIDLAMQINAEKPLDRASYSR